MKTLRFKNVHLCRNCGYPHQMKKGSAGVYPRFCRDCLPVPSYSSRRPEVVDAELDDIRRRRLGARR